MKIKDLKKKIEKLPDDMDVGVADHFGNFEEVDEIEFYVTTTLDRKKTFFNIPIVEIGEEPE